MTTTDTTTEAPYVWVLSPAEFAATVDKIAKVNARAAKRGFTGRFEVTGTTRTITETDYFGFKRTRIVVDATVTGTAPAYEGWTFLAALDWDPNAGLIVRTAPGVESIDRTGLVEHQCQHCNTVRRNRRRTFVVASGARTLQVGTSCLKDFLGWSGNPVFIDTEAVRGEVEAAAGSGGWAGYSTETVLAYAWAAVKVLGWVPRSGYGQPTADVVVDLLSGRTKTYKPETLAALREIAAESADRAAETRAIILSDEFNGTSEYVLNMKAVIAADYVSQRNLGLAVSAVQAAAKAQEQTLVRKEKDALPASEFIGNVGDKVEFTGQITMIRYIDNGYGTTVLYVIRNQTTGVEVKWFASKEALGDTQGVEVTLKGTVKAHDTYQGRKSTVLTRCKAV